MAPPSTPCINILKVPSPLTPNPNWPPTPDQLSTSEMHKDKKPYFYGTPLYASCGALRGGLPCPRDDVEGLLYTLLTMVAPLNTDGRHVKNSLPFDVSLATLAKVVPCSL